MNLLSELIMPLMSTSSKLGITRPAARATIPAAHVPASRSERHAPFAREAARRPDFPTRRRDVWTAEAAPWVCMIPAERLPV
jgi:hypothetical protein